jgi:protein-S-isoprenylcysteine O-methyltransferase Ste14
MDFLNKFKEGILKVIGYLVPVFQYIPNASIWKGIMSLPLIGYLIAFFQNPSILLRDFYFFFRYPGIYIIFLGTLFFIYSLIYQIIHRKELIKKGPYKYIRHPQYVSIIISS